MSTKKFEITHFVKAPREVVFDYFTVAERMIEWHGVEAELDPRPGGRFRVRHADGSVLEGEFVEIEAPWRIVFTWGFAEDPERTAEHTPAGASRVEVRLYKEPDGTRIELRHSNFDAADDVGHGWEYFLSELSAAL